MREPAKVSKTALREMKIVAPFNHGADNLGDAFGFIRIPLNFRIRLVNVVL